ncbi:META domain-containing protein [Marinovum algicola]|uniref:META domain-containing protein n=1 Tax=Marinovum algicola TaxID=42444 RepID=UPI0024B89891|nr:META domain-containing protein [Marinovum algicola]
MTQTLIAAALSAFASLSATLSGAQDTETHWKLQSIDGQVFEARATLTFPTPAQIAGSTPCNRFFGIQTEPLPGFGAARMGVTQRMCPQFREEAAFLAALREMTISEFDGNRLVLRNEDGREMVFVAVN